jgi:triosephosphate isomerase
MNKTPDEAGRFCRELAPRVADVDDVQAVIVPPFPALAAAAEALRGSALGLGAQNVHAEASGAFTGEVSSAMLVAVGCSHVIVGHSERRSLFGETSAEVAAKVRAAQGVGLIPIVCVGEPLDDRQADRALETVGQQLQDSLRGATLELVIAYEPVWAIGTGRTATPEMAQEMHAFVRERLGALLGPAAAEIRIQYGGSVKPENTEELMAQPDVDGALVGGASLDPESFSAIIRASRPPPETAP